MEGISIACVCVCVCVCALCNAVKVRLKKSVFHMFITAMASLIYRLSSKMSQNKKIHIQDLQITQTGKKNHTT